MKLSIGVFTGRTEPRLSWIIDALGEQARPDDEIEIIVVDALAEFRELEIAVRSPAIRNVVITPPKPTIWQGPHRVTSTDWWAMSNARNTFICLAAHDYIACIDDRSKPGPLWLQTVRRGWRTRDAIYAGSYDKIEGPPDERMIAPDHRRGMKPDGMVNCGGGWLFGCTFCLPLEWALEVNGFEEGNDGLTGEDYLFGLLLHNSGRRIDFVPDLFVLQDRQDNDHTKKRYKTLDKGVSPNDKSHAVLTRFGTRKRTELTPDLREIRSRLAAGKSWPVPDPSLVWRDWYDDQPIRDM